MSKLVPITGAAIVLATIWLLTITFKQNNLVYDLMALAMLMVGLGLIIFPMAFSVDENLLSEQGRSRQTTSYIPNSSRRQKGACSGPHTEEGKE